MSLVYVPARGPINPKIAFVGEAPSYAEVEALEPFVGPSGKFLNSMLRDAGIDRNSCWVTNVCKYEIEPLAKGSRKKFSERVEELGISFEQQVNELRNELLEVNPNVIVPLGASALWAITGKSKIQKLRGSIITGFGKKLIATYHPAHILHQEGDLKGYWNKQVMLFDLKRIKAQSEFSEVILPKRNLSVAKSSYALQQFLERNRGRNRPAVDIEAKNCIPYCIGLAFNPMDGITIPLWTGISDSDRANTWSLIDKILKDSEVVGQNFGYDRDKIRRLGFIVAGLASDTMLKAFCINPELPKNLAFNTSIYTEEPYYKDEGMYEGSDEDLMIGCARDACVTKEIDIAMDADIDKLGLRNYYEEFILPLHEIYFYNENLDAIEQVGFKVNEDLRRELIRKYIERDEEIRHRLFKLSGTYINCSSPKQVSELVFDKFKLPMRKGTGEEELTALLNNNVKNELQREVLSLILEDRQVKKTLSSYLYSPTDFDGRMRTTYFICLDTGRSATKQQEPPSRPTVEFEGREEGKKVKKETARGMAFQTITKHGDIGADIRRMLVVDNGYVFLQVDSSQAEARIVTHLANDKDRLQLYDTHDIHAISAALFFGGSESDYDKKIIGYEKPERFGGKTLTHAGHLGASKTRAAVEINTQARKYKIDFRMSEAEAQKCLNKFHASFPKLKQVFHAEVIRCLERNRRLIAPAPFGINSPIGGIRTFFERWNDELFRQAFAYLPQRTVTENTKAAALRIRGSKKLAGRAPWIKILVESHDSLLTMVPIEREAEAAQILKEEMERPIDFTNCSLSRGKIVIPADIERGFNYKDLSKFKFKELTNEVKANIG